MRIELRMLIMIMTAGQDSTLELRCTTYTHSRPMLQVANHLQRKKGIPILYITYCTNNKYFELKTRGAAAPTQNTCSLRSLLCHSQ